MQIPIVIEPQSLQIKGRTMPNSPSLADFIALLGEPRIEFKPGPVPYNWIWDECGIRVYGDSDQKLAGATICLRSPASTPSADSYGGSDTGLHSDWPSGRLSGQLMVFGVSLAADDTPLSFHSRVFSHAPNTVTVVDGKLQVSERGINGSDTNGSELHFKTRDDERLFLQFFDYANGYTRFWCIQFYFPKREDAPQKPLATEPVSNTPRSSPTLVDRTARSVAADETVRIFVRWFWGGGWQLAAILIIVLIIWAYLSH